MKTYSIPEAHQIVYELEEQYNLLQYKVGEWSIWPALRWNFFNAITGERLIGERVSWSFTQLAEIIRKDIAGLMHVPKARHLILTKDINLREQIGEYYTDVFFDELASQLSDFVKVDTLHNPAFFNTRKRASIQSRFSLTLFRRIPHLIPLSLTPSNLQQTANELSQILSRFTSAPQFSPQRLRREFADFELSKHMFGWLLQKMQPRFLLLLNAHSCCSYVAAAKERGITVIELQHGVLYRYHPGYSWNSAALPYKSKMPIPDYIFMYGDYWRETLEHNGFWGDDLQVVGSPRIDRFRSFTPPKSNAIHLAVTTQWLISPAVYGEYIQKFLQLTKDRFDLQITVKLHQKETTKEPYEDWFRDYPNVKVVLNHEAPSTFELLRSADIHLSVASTCHYEALALGTPTVILPFIDHEALQPLLNRSYSTVCATPESLVDFLAGFERKAVDHSIGDYFFKPNAVGNMLRFLQNPPKR